MDMFCRRCHRPKIPRDLPCNCEPYQVRWQGDEREVTIFAADVGAAAERFITDIDADDPCDYGVCNTQVKAPGGPGWISVAVTISKSITAAWTPPPPPQKPRPYHARHRWDRGETIVTATSRREAALLYAAGMINGEEYTVTVCPVGGARGTTHTVKVEGGVPTLVEPEAQDLFWGGE